jgi:ankyrin repeat protein
MAGTAEALGGFRAIDLAEARAKGVQLLKACADRRVKDALLLIHQGAHLDCISEKGGETPLMIASSYAELDSVATALVNAGANIDAVSNIGNTALILACSHNRGDTALFLLQKGARHTFVAKDNKTALAWALTNRLGNVAAYIRSANAVYPPGVAQDAAERAAVAPREAAQPAGHGTEPAAAAASVGESEGRELLGDGGGRKRPREADEGGRQSAAAAASREP